METYLITAQFDNRAGEGRIASRIGIGEPADTFAPGEDLFAKIDGAALPRAPSPASSSTRRSSCPRIRSGNWPAPWMILACRSCATACASISGANLFPGSAALLAWADEMREVRTICHCGKKATMVVRKGPDGRALRDGEQVLIGGNETYVSLCRRHWREAVGDTA